MHTVVNRSRASVLEYNVRIKSIIEVAASLAVSHSFDWRTTLNLVERGGAHRSFLCVHEMGIDVALSLVSLVNDFHVSRNFALDTRVSLVPQLAFLFLFLSTSPHIVDRAANDFRPLIFFDVLIDVRFLLPRRKTHGCSLLASR